MFYFVVFPQFQDPNLLSSQQPTDWTRNDIQITVQLSAATVNPVQTAGS